MNPIGRPSILREEQEMALILDGVVTSRGIREVLSTKNVERAGSSTNKGHGQSKSRRRMVKASRKKNRK